MRSSRRQAQPIPFPGAGAVKQVIKVFALPAKGFEGDYHVGTGGEAKASEDPNVGPQIEPNVTREDFKVESRPFVAASHHDFVHNFFIPKSLGA